MKTRNLDYDALKHKHDQRSEKYIFSNKFFLHFRRDFYSFSSFQRRFVFDFTFLFSTKVRQAQGHPCQAPDPREGKWPPRYQRLEQLSGLQCTHFYVETNPDQTFFSFFGNVDRSNIFLFPVAIRKNRSEAPRPSRPSEIAASSVKSRYIFTSRRIKTQRFHEIY